MFGQSDAGLDATWFKKFSGGKDITADVLASDYDFSVGAGKTRRFRTRVEPTVNTNVC